MVRDGQVIIHCFGHADGVQLVPLVRRQLADFVGRIRRVVAPDVEEIAYAMDPEDLKQPFIVLILHLVAHRSQGRRGRMAQQFQGLGRFTAQVNELLVKYAGDAVQHAIDLADAFLLQRFVDDAHQAAIDDCRRAAGLADEKVPFAETHSTPPAIFANCAHDYQCGEAQLARDSGSPRAPEPNICERDVLAKKARL